MHKLKEERGIVREVFRGQCFQIGRYYGSENEPIKNFLIKTKKKKSKAKQIEAQIYRMSSDDM